MRFIVWTAIIALMAASVPDIRNRVMNWIDPVDDPNIEAAIELRCADEVEAFRDDCAIELRHDFEVGVREPEAIVRRHCTRIVSDWAIHAGTPLPICNEQYGGWIKG